MRRLLIASILTLALGRPASAEWTKDQRTRFLASCVTSCQGTSGLSDVRKAACSPACTCLANHGENMMTPADYDEADKAAAEDKSTTKMDALAKYFPACAKQALGQ